MSHKRIDGYQASKHVNTPHRCKQFTANSIKQTCALKTDRKNYFLFSTYILLKLFTSAECDFFPEILQTRIHYKFIFEAGARGRGVPLRFSIPQCCA